MGAAVTKREWMRLFERACLIADGWDRSDLCSGDPECPWNMEYMQRYEVYGYDRFHLTAASMLLDGAPCEALP